MSEDEDTPSFGPTISEFVAEVENSIAECVDAQLERGGSGLDLPELLMDLPACNARVVF